MKELRKIAALNGNLKRIFFVTGAGVIYSLGSLSSAQAEGDTSATPSEPNTVSSETTSQSTATVESVTTEVTTAQTTLDTTVSNATSYQLEQNTTVIADAQTAINDANTAVTLASTAASNLSAASTTLSTAQTELTNAQTTLSTANDTVVAQTAVVATDTQNVTTATTTLQEAQAVIDANTTPGLAVTIYSNPGTNASPTMGGNVVYTGTDTNGINEQWGSGGPTVNGATTTTTVTETFAGNHLNTTIGITVNGTPVSTTNNNNIYIGSIGFPAPGQDPSLSLRTPTASTVITMPTNTTSASFDVFAKNGNSTATVTYTDGTTDTFVIQDDVNPNYPGYVHQEVITAPSGKTIANITIPTDWDYYGIDNVSATSQTTTTTTVTNDFQVRWQGIWTPQTTGTQYITANADDGTRLYLDGNLVIDDWVDKGGGGSTADIATTAGVSQTFDFWFYENGGGANVSLLRYTGTGWEVIPASEFSQTTATQTQKDAVTSASAALSVATSTLATDQTILSNLQTTQAQAQDTVVTKQTAVTTATTTLTTAQDVYNVTIATANSLAATATEKVATAVTAVSNTPTHAPQPLPDPSPEPQPQPDPTPVTPTPDVPPSQEETPTPPSQDDSSTSDSSDVPTDATDTSTDTSSTDSQPTDTTPTPTPEPTPAPTPDPTPAPTPEPVSTPGMVSNNPDSLPETTPKLPETTQLVAHVQEDKAGVENGGIEFFGTKSQPQVIGEDGKLTPPPPPPGSGLPIPEGAITTSDTFIGQPGGTTFNAPDVAVPVQVTYVCHTVTKNDGTQVHLDVNGDEHKFEQCQFLPAALDAIPGAGEAIQAMSEAFAAMSNIGNDMSPITRQKAKKILVATIVGGALFRRRFGE